MSTVLTTQTNTNIQHLNSQQFTQLNPHQQQTPIAQTAASPEQTMALSDIVTILIRRKVLVLVVLLSILVITGIYTLSIPISYQANAMIQIENEGAQIVSFGRTNDGAVVSSPDASNDPFFRTRYEVLRSRVLAKSVIEELQLYDSLSPKTKKSTFSLSTLAISLGLIKAPKKVVAAPIDYTAIFQRNLFVQAVAKTHLVNIWYEAPSAVESKNVLDTVIRTFIDIQIQTKSETGKYAKNFLGQQLSEAKSRLRVSETALVNYSNEKGILAVDATQTRDVTKLVNLDAALVQAEVRRIEVESLYREMQRFGSVSTVLNSAVVTSLKANLVQLEGNYQEKLKIFKPNYPDMVRLQQQINTVRGKLQTEKSSIERSLEADYISSKKQEDRLRAEIKQFNKKLYKLQDSSLDYNTLKREVDTNGQLYKSLLQRYEEVNVASAVNTSSIKIVEPAVLPLKRSNASLKNNLIIGLFAGLLFGIALAFLRESLDRAINSADELEKFTGLPILGMIPKTSALSVKKQMRIINTDKVPPRSSVIEAYRVLSTNIRFMLKSQDNQVLLITSAHPSEGKSTTAINMAHCYAQMGMKVLLVDANIRNPSLHENLNLHNKQGLSHYLKGEIDLVGITQPVKKVNGLYVITAGAYDVDPVLLISNERMSYLTTQGSLLFDYVIIDAPPIDGFSDTLILSSLASSTIIVTKEGDIISTTIKRILNQLACVKQNVLGFMIIGVKKPEVSKKGYEKHDKKALKLQRKGTNLKDKALAILSGN